MSKFLLSRISKPCQKNLFWLELNSTSIGKILNEEKFAFLHVGANKNRAAWVAEIPSSACSKITFLGLFISSMFLISSVSIAAEDEKMPLHNTATNLSAQPLTGRNMNPDSYTGIVINQTVTVAGSDFFQYFIAAWRDNEMVDNYAISINERPTARFGSQIWVTYGQRRVFQAFLPPARSAIKSIALSVADQVYQTVVEADVQRILFRDPDLAQDEF